MEIAYLLEQQGEPFALLDLDYLSWGGTGSSDRASEFGLMLQNLTAVAENYRRAGIRLFVLAYFVRSLGEVQQIGKALGLPLRVARLTAELPVIEERLASDVTSGRRGDLLAAAAALAVGEGTGVEDVVIRNARRGGSTGGDQLPQLALTQTSMARPDIHSCRCQTAGFQTWRAILRKFPPRIAVMAAEG